MLLAKDNWQNMLSQAVLILKENTDELSKLDAATGDGDHGVTIGKIADKIHEHLDAWPADTSVQVFLENISNALTNISGGSAGPLWGTLFEGFAAAADQQMDAVQVKKIYSCAVESMREISTAKIGDKTMMDALLPAAEAAKNCSGDIQSIFAAAAVAAAQGADNTANMIAKFGRAKNLKEKTLGHKDPGAVSLSLLFKAFAIAMTKPVTK